MLTSGISKLNGRSSHSMKTILLESVVVFDSIREIAAIVSN